ncbi:unnamed protein product [Amoebophrya sp. A25]|nr:unnamed protein product [Amoebophrya sp. A25]|eukprot:GSA25T00015515001.1
MVWMKIYLFRSFLPQLVRNHFLEKAEENPCTTTTSKKSLLSHATASSLSTNVLSSSSGSSTPSSPSTSRAATAEDDRPHIFAERSPLGAETTPIDGGHERDRSIFTSKRGNAGTSPSGTGVPSTPSRTTYGRGSFPTASFTNQNRAFSSTTSTPSSSSSSSGEKRYQAPANDCHDSKNSVQNIFGAAITECYGCGPGNVHGFRLNSYVIPDYVKLDFAPDKRYFAQEAFWRPQPYHCGPPGYLYGGLSASLLDCLANWTAAVAHTVWEEESRGGTNGGTESDSSSSNPKSPRGLFNANAFCGTSPQTHRHVMNAINTKRAQFGLSVTGTLNLKYLRPVPIREEEPSDSSTTNSTEPEKGSSKMAPIYLRSRIDKVDGRKFFVSGGIFSDWRETTKECVSMTAVLIMVDKNKTNTKNEGSFTTLNRYKARL